MKRTLLGAMIVGVLATIAGFVAGLMAGEPTTERVERISRKAPELVAVPVTVQDIPLGTVISNENVSDYFALKHFPRYTVPPGSVKTLDELAGKRTQRRLRFDGVVNDQDVGHILELPFGTAESGIRIATTRAESGFALPGYKVTVCATKWSEKKQKEVFLPVAFDALILAVDYEDTPAEGAIVSIAATPEQSELLRTALEGGAALRIGLQRADEGLPYETDTTVFLAPAKSAEELLAFLSGE